MTKVLMLVYGRTSARCTFGLAITFTSSSWRVFPQRQWTVITTNRHSCLRAAKIPKVTAITPPLSGWWRLNMSSCLDFWSRRDNSTMQVEPPTRLLYTKYTSTSSTCRCSASNWRDCATSCPTNCFWWWWQIFNKWRTFSADWPWATSPSVC
jgi:hypothetical protein